jgi:SAM-dependent methyltransferase
MDFTCHFCRSGLFRLHSKVPDPVTGEHFDLYRCSNCGLGQTFPKPVDIQRYYPDGYYGNRHGFTARRCLARRLHWLRMISGPANNKTLLDIGCGDGSFLIRAKSAGYRVFGTESRPAQAQAAGLDVRKRIQDFREHAHFDLITLWHSLEHMTDPRETLAQSGRRLTETGVLMIAVPDSGGLQASLLGPHWVHFDVPRHLYHFNLPSLSYGLKDAGLHVFRKWHQEMEYDLMGWSQSVLNRLSARPHVFFNLFTGKRDGTAGWLRSLHFVAGSLLSGLALPLLAGGTFSGRGGTLIVAASKKNRAFMG